MSALKSQPARKTVEVSRGGKTEISPFKQALEIATRQIRTGQPVLISTMPRGSFQILQPGRLDENLFKSYAREFHLEDRLTWQAIQSRKPVSLRDVQRDDARFSDAFLQVNGFAFAAAAPLACPLLDGYPGAVHVYRRTEDGDFSADELRKLGDLARQIDTVFSRARAARRTQATEPHIRLTHRPASRLFVFDSQGRQVNKGADFDAMDSQLRSYLSDEARARLSMLNGQPFAADRVQLQDSRGDLWSFRCAAFAKYPALGEGSFVVMAMHPTCVEWSVLRPGDVAADDELARLVPALKFMRQEFHRGPTLGEISGQVDLSPFHFHRRFAELFGLTPKHYMLECQITEAKVQLAARKKQLTQIAQDCGFAHQSHFTSRFKQATGLTPTRWRKLAGDSRRGG